MEDVKNAIVCFYWQGERWRETSKIDGEFANHLGRVGTASKSLVSKYVNNLYRGCKRFSDRNFKFILFTNEKLEGLDENVEVRSFKLVSKKGVLPRVFMFSEEAGLFGYQVLSLDLDLVIVGSLKDILSYDGQFCTRGMFIKGKEHVLDGDIMSFKAGKAVEDKFYKPFVNDVEFAEKMTQGRERFWIRYVTGNKADNWHDIAPGQVVSYKRSMGKNGQKVLPKNARIVSCHGHPRPHQINESWIQKYWK